MGCGRTAYSAHVCGVERQAMYPTDQGWYTGYAVAHSEAGECAGQWHSRTLHSPKEKLTVNTDTAPAQTPWSPSALTQDPNLTLVTASPLTLCVGQKLNSKKENQPRGFLTAPLMSTTEESWFCLHVSLTTMN